MPTERTFNPGATTSRMPWSAARARSAASGLPLLRRFDHVAAGFLVGFELDEAFLFGFLEEVGKATEAIVRLVEARVAALECLLHHRAPDALVGVALGHQRVERAEHQVEGLLLLVAVALVAARARGRGLAPLLRRAALLLVGAHQVVVVDELVAVVDQQIRARVLHADA